MSHFLSLKDKKRWTSWREFIFQGLRLHTLVIWWSKQEVIVNKHSPDSASTKPKSLKTCLRLFILNLLPKSCVQLFETELSRVFTAGTRGRQKCHEAAQQRCLLPLCRLVNQLDCSHKARLAHAPPPHTPRLRLRVSADHSGASSVLTVYHQLSPRSCIRL